MSTDDKQPNLEQLTTQISQASISVFAWQHMRDRLSLALERICELEENATKRERQIVDLETVLKATVEAYAKRLKTIEDMLGSDNLFRPADGRDDTYSLYTPLEEE